MALSGCGQGKGKQRLMNVSKAMLIVLLENSDADLDDNSDWSEDGNDDSIATVNEAKHLKKEVRTSHLLWKEQQILSDSIPTRSNTAQLHQQIDEALFPRNVDDCLPTASSSTKLETDASTVDFNNTIETRTVHKMARLEERAYQSANNKSVAVIVLSKGCESSTCVKLAKSGKRLCNNFSERDKEAIFTEFWAMQSWDERKAFVRTLIIMVEAK
ncbi:PiggyBac transposable element-derived protein 4-like [Plakobranchus ocellatus]|uniref:PiggyBac transposable element-derived protein 4-like n=1 Tax=Plakobranchus ocellatus TaxID=259542 RepID=A0AAV3WUI2_9GAST|nr:PiggyBac transposable element-derived protein 4-like [Plakobranchus ocellatus]